MRDKVIAVFCLIDDMLKSIGHKDDVRRTVSDSEVITTAFVSAIYFGGNHAHAISFMRSTILIPNMIEASRFSRRLHKVSGLLYELFCGIAQYLKVICCEMQYVIDSFPVAVCDNMRIGRSKILKGNKWRGYTASLRKYFYGIKVQLLVTAKGIPVSFHFTAGKSADVKGLERLLQDLPPEASVYADSAYTAYAIEDAYKENKGILLKVQRKENAKRKDSTADILEKLSKRKRVETTISDIKKRFPRTIHAVTLNGLLIKIICFICAEQVKHIIN